MKKTWFFIVLVLFSPLLVLGTGPVHAQLSDYEMAELRHQMDTIKRQLDIALKSQKKISLKELERLKREIEIIRLEIEEDLKREQKASVQEREELKTYLTNFKFETERLRQEIDVAIKMEIPKLKLESDSAKIDFVQFKVTAEKINLESVVAAKPKPETLAALKPTLAKNAPLPVPIGEITPVKITPRKEPVKPKAVPLPGLKAAIAVAATKEPPSKNAGPEKREKESSAKGGTPKAATVPANDAKPDDGGQKDREEKLEYFSGEINDAKQSIASSVNPREHWITLGKANLETERYWKSLAPKEKGGIVRSEKYSNAAFGGYEAALLSFTQALSLNPNDADTLFLVGQVYDEIKDGVSAWNYAERAKLAFGKRGDSESAAKADAYAKFLKKKYDIARECRPAAVVC